MARLQKHAHRWLLILVVAITCAPTISGAQGPTPIVFTFTKIAAVDEQAPGTSWTFKQFGAPTIDGPDVAFIGEGGTFSSSGGWPEGGVFAHLGGTLVRIADDTTLMPGHPSPPETFDGVGGGHVDGGLVAFDGYGTGVRYPYPGWQVGVDPPMKAPLSR